MTAELRASCRRRARLFVALLLALLPNLVPRIAAAQDRDTRFEVYGFVMLDAGYQFNASDPLWFDVVRPTRLPAFDDEFGEDGRAFWGVRQTRFGVKSYTLTSRGELRITFEWELFGVGVDAGQTTFRLRHAYGELGAFGAGQTWSPFMDIDVFPNSIEYWGPNGMAFFRNVQVRWMPIRDEDDGDRVTIALERPGASGDAGLLEDRIELDNVRGRFPLPDLSAEYRKGAPWGYVELAGIVRYIAWDDLLDDVFDLDGDAIGWGLNLTSNVKVGPGKRNVFRLGVLYGEGIQNYMNDAPVDVGLRVNPGNLVTPVLGEALPVLGLVAFYDHRWNDRYTSSIGWSMIDIDNSDLQLPAAFRRGHYALVNLLYYPITNLMVGGEFQFGRRENFTDDWTANDFRFQFSAKYNYLMSIGGSK